MPYAPTTASVPDDAPDSAPWALTLGVAASLVSLGAVVAGFALVAASLMGVGTVPIGWGAGLCVGGWTLAAVVRERTGRPGHGAEDAAATEAAWPAAREAA